MIFTKVVRVRGNLWASYVFKDDKAVSNWLVDEFPLLEIEHGKLTYSVETLDGLKVGDTCMVIGEGHDLFVIKKLIVYSPNRYGFALDSGWSEEVAKCYKPLSPGFVKTS